MPAYSTRLQLDFFSNVILIYFMGYCKHHIFSKCNLLWIGNSQQLRERMKFAKAECRNGERNQFHLLIFWKQNCSENENGIKCKKKKKRRRKGLFTDVRTWEMRACIHPVGASRHMPAILFHHAPCSALYTVYHAIHVHLHVPYLSWSKLIFLHIKWA